MTHELLSVLNIHLFHIQLIAYGFTSFYKLFRFSVHLSVLQTVLLSTYNFSDYIWHTVITAAWFCCYIIRSDYFFHFDVKWFSLTFASFQSSEGDSWHPVLLEEIKRGLRSIICQRIWRLRFHFLILWACRHFGHKAYIIYDWSHLWAGLNSIGLKNMINEGTRFICELKVWSAFEKFKAFYKQCLQALILLWGVPVTEDFSFSSLVAPLRFQKSSVWYTINHNGCIWTVTLPAFSIFYFVCGAIL